MHFSFTITSSSYLSFHFQFYRIFFYFGINYFNDLLNETVTKLMNRRLKDDERGRVRERQRKRKKKLKLDTCRFDIVN